MQQLNRQTAKQSKPTKNQILLFGGGNFVRAFIGWIVEEKNKKSDAHMGITVVKVTPGDYTDWKNQDGLYHVNTKGILSGSLLDKTDLISSVNTIISTSEEWDKFMATAQDTNYRFLISNTTESGLKYKEEAFDNAKVPNEFPAKITQWLYARYKHFNGDLSKGCVFIPCELLIDNGVLLKSLIEQYIDLWKLDGSFKKWVNDSCNFCNTLVDRIVPGISKDNLAAAQEKLGFEDVLVTEGEPYHLFVIEAPQEVRDQLPIDKIGLNVIYTDDLSPFRLRKVRILNGAHSTMVPVGLVYGVETVGELMSDQVLEKFVLDAVDKEIIPATDLPEEELKAYADEIMDRFRNPFIKHRLMSISLNSFSKYRSRILPTVLDYHQKFDTLPPRLLLAFACMLRLYKGSINGAKVALKDDALILDRMKNLWSNVDAGQISLGDLVLEIASDKDLWAMDLTELQGFSDKIEDYLEKIENGQLPVILNNIP